ncbi:MAG: aminotransferase class I/II-fold pyridoxal phosphate-dependent enzyme [Acidobacteriaceae bacterium]
MITRRSFFKVAAGAGAAAAISSSLTDRIFALEPRRWNSTQPSGPILLNSNENAYGPFPSVLAISNPFQDANRYPFHSVDALAHKLAVAKSVRDDQVLLGCGSTEIIKLAVNAFTSPQRKLVMAAPTFEAAEMHARAVGTPVAHVPLAPDYSHDLEAMLAQAHNAGLVYLCNPNNPTGSLTARKQLESFITRLPSDTYVLMDEAYHDFVPPGADYKSFIDAPIANDRLIVARTFSKIYGIAGLRLGYAVAAPDAITKMQTQSQSDSVNAFALRCATASLDDPAAHRLAVQRNAADRDEFMRQTLRRNLTAIPSTANFVMLDARLPVKQVIAHFEQHNLLVGRPFPPYLSHLRVSLGTPPEMVAFWQAWDALPQTNTKVN